MSDSCSDGCQEGAAAAGFDLDALKVENPVMPFLRQDRLPHIWCPGCGIGTAFSSCLSAIKATEIPYNQFTMVSGIGCSARGAGYIKLDSFHTTHGRAIPFASGIKMAKPDLNVIVFSGDGDLFAIGGNHFIHAARRNIDMTAIVMNNRIYGMTGGQFSPLSGPGVKATTAPYKTIDNSFDVVELAKAAGATFVARSTAFHVKECTEMLAKAILHKGFSVVEIMSQCPTHFGRKNKEGDAVNMLGLYRDNTAKLGSKALEEKPGLIPRGIFVEEERPEYCEEYDKIIAYAMKEKIS